ncbi:hypothetical protein [Novosphingobium panipatense]|uniref:UrcA family protein n=1 Tax=Novosphingobium panipatense TaxID=428991 RepID=A0ABY1PX02_9SPHN|nr:hypothetical protein [Novosphingobium panipatense]SMP51704.1 hypothetical protein SAMN06296065_101164 [Novosphingobium panipatense]
MSLLVLAAMSAAAAAAPVHTVNLEHRGSTYTVDYRSRVETSTRSIGISPPTRPSSQRCVMTATVSVERAITDGGHELTAKLPGKETYTRQLPGSCSGRDAQLAKLVEDKSDAINAHLAQLAAKDRSHAIAAIDAAHHFASN